MLLLNVARSYSKKNNNQLSEVGLFTKDCKQNMYKASSVFSFYVNVHDVIIL